MVDAEPPLAEWAPRDAELEAFALASVDESELALDEMEVVGAVGAGAAEARDAPRRAPRADELQEDRFVVR